MHKLHYYIITVCVGSHPLFSCLWTHWFQILGCVWWSCPWAAFVIYLGRRGSSAPSPRWRRSKVFWWGHWGFVPPSSLVTQCPAQGVQKGLGRGGEELWRVGLISDQLRDWEHGLFSGSWEELNCSSFGASDKSDVYKSWWWIDFWFKQALVAGEIK